MRIATGGMDEQTAYRLLTGAIVPRPIAWITTLSSSGVVNLAPFSCFTYVSTNPPMVGFNSGRQRDHDGVKLADRKDTAINIFATGEFVVNVVDESLLGPMHASADYYAPEVSEVETLGLRTLPSETVSVPRLEASLIHLECRYRQAVSFGGNGAEFIVGEITMFHIRDELIMNGKIDSSLLRPLGRLAGPTYGTMGEIHAARPNTLRRNSTS